MVGTVAPREGSDWTRRPMQLRPFGMAGSSMLIALGLLSSVAARDGGWINPNESMPAVDMPSTEAGEGVAGSDQGNAHPDTGSAATLRIMRRPRSAPSREARCRLPAYAGSGFPTVRQGSSSPLGLAISWRRRFRPGPSWWGAKHSAAYLASAVNVVRRRRKGTESRKSSSLLSCFLTGIDPLVRRALLSRRRRR
jgi:hypothetical protein